MRGDGIKHFFFVLYVSLELCVDCAKKTFIRIEYSSMWCKC